LGGVTAQKVMEVVAVGRETGAEEIVDLDGLFIADQRNHAEAGGLAGVVFLIFGLLDGRDGWLHERFTEMGVIEYEDYVDTSVEYSELNAIERDSAAAAAAQ